MLDRADKTNNNMYLKDHSLFNLVAKTRPHDGEEAIRFLLFCLAFLQPKSTLELARLARLPLPLTAAIRKESEKAGILSRGSGLRLQDRGIRLAEELFGIKPFSWRETRDDLLHKVKVKLEEYIGSRPRFDRALDQSHATLDTLVQRVAYLFRHDCLAGRQFVLLGDDDFTSLAAGFFLQALGLARDGRSLVNVFELDARIVNALTAAARSEKLALKVHAHDLRRPIAGEFADRFDAAFTDPPYTANGSLLFAVRALPLLRWGTGRRVLICLPRMKRDILHIVQRDLAARGLLLEDVIRDFNTYQGNSLYAHKSDLYVYSTGPVTDAGEPVVEQLYTADCNPKTKDYLCNTCGKVLPTGPGRPHTIDGLKHDGCPFCGGKHFTRKP